MKILRRHFIKEFFKFFMIVIVIVTVISTVMEFFDRVDKFYQGDAKGYLIAQYLMLRVPGVVLYSLPFASLFSILIVLGVASKWRETVVIRASGCSLKKFFSSFLVLGVLISLFAFVFGETIVPAATEKATYIRNVKILKRSQKIIRREKQIWLKGTDGSLIRIDSFAESGNRILKTSIFRFGPAFGLEERIEADEAEWKNGVWNLKGVTVFDFKGETVKDYDSMISTSLEEPEIFREEIKNPIEMNFLELHTYYSRLEKAGFKNLQYLVRLYEKLAYPAINFVMILFGISLALNTRWGGGVKAAGLGIIISIVYWLFYSISVSLGVTGVLKPWVASSLCPFLFGIAGSILYWRIKE
ncbi:MAG: LptF/LptG family permease [Nitrospirota bacterium]|nr:LptF/LptG family permease [Nitrospirota bacterium]